jgi:hypothetical protein
MTHILGDLRVQLNESGTACTLLDPLVFHVGLPTSKEVVEVPAGFGTDFVSVPWFVRWAVSTWEKTARAAVVHDFLYSSPGRAAYPYSRFESDAIFLEVLGVVKHKQRWLAWATVRAFGWKAWNANAAKAKLD